MPLANSVEVASDPILKTMSIQALATFFSSELPHSMAARRRSKVTLTSSMFLEVRTPTTELAICSFSKVIDWY